MAKGVEGAPVAAAGKRKRASGPRKAADTHVFLQVFDGNGNHIPDAQLEVGHQTKDARSAMNFMDSEEGKQFKRFVIKGATGVAKADGQVKEPTEV